MALCRKTPTSLLVEVAALMESWALIAPELYAQGYRPEKFSRKPRGSVAANANTAGLYCTPKVTLPMLADDNPTLACRRNIPRTPAPVSALKCDSRLKLAFRPPPKSSELRKPQMLAEIPPLYSWVVFVVCTLF